MGKASRKKRAEKAGAKEQRAPYVARPFEGLADETDWVAMREILPAATATVTVDVPEGTEIGGRAVPAGEREVTLVTVLPAAMPALHRDTGEVLVALQSRTSSGDASRDVVQAMLTAIAAEPGTSVNSVRPATASTPRLQDLLVDGQRLEVQVHDDFGFWLGEDATDEQKAMLEQMNDTAVPMERLEGAPSAFWCLMTGRAYIRWILGEDEDDATRAVARLQAAGEHTLGEGTELLGAFRAAGLLVPVLEVDPEAEPASHSAALGELQARYEKALASDEPLTTEERRARDGLVSRQVTLR
ncbi:MAG: topoisomerase II [Acidobacteria bacterium]|nr:MAG: topoisomerase II [Acidobacteriota bacterium]